MNSAEFNNRFRELVEGNPTRVHIIRGASDIDSLDITKAMAAGPHAYDNYDENMLAYISACLSEEKEIAIQAAGPDKVIVHAARGLFRTPASFNENLKGIPLQMVLVPGGTFKMGVSDHNDFDYAKPQHDVTVAGFHMSRCPITQSQWFAVMGTNPSSFTGAEGLPVESVSWFEATEFCEKLSQMSGRACRLPSEAEWEYACRAGTTGDYAGNADQMAWHNGNSGGQTQPVGQKQPNAFGLYDMHGNVWEWCADTHHIYYQGAPTDGSAWTIGGDQSLREIRGGCWYDDLESCTSFWRGQVGAEMREQYTGFRVVMDT